MEEDMDEVMDASRREAIEDTEALLASLRMAREFARGRGDDPMVRVIADAIYVVKRVMHERGWWTRERYMEASGEDRDRAEMDEAPF